MKKTIHIFSLTILFFLFSCRTQYYPWQVRGKYYKIDKQYNAITDPKIDSIVAPYKAKLDAVMNEQIGTSEGLNIEKPESSLGNWIADAIEEKANNISEGGVDFAAQNYGGIRIKEIPQGTITYGRIFELMPFENYLSIITVPGDVLQKFLDRLAVYGGWPVSKSISFRIENEKATDIKIKNKAFDLKKTYKIALPDYVAHGGDDCSFFENLPLENSEILIRDILMENVRENNKSGKAIASRIEGRIKK